MTEPDARDETPEPGSVLPERTWTPGDDRVLPPLPEECYPADAQPLEEHG